MILAPLDFVRARTLRVLGRPGRALLAERALRVDVFIVIGLVTSLAVALAVPFWAFALGPIVLGVPHLVADVRYLVVRHGLHRQRALAFCTAATLLAATITGSTAVGLASAVFPVVFAPARAWRRFVVLVACGVVIAAAHRFPRVATLILVHGHNVAAIALFAFLFARTTRAKGLLLIGFAFIGGLLLRGPGIGAFFVFAQSVHYVVWLRLVPDEARERPGLRSFASSFRALRAEVGGALLVVAAIFFAVVCVRAVTSIEAARVLYLRGASFHGYLEIACALHLGLARR